MDTTASDCSSALPPLIFPKRTCTVNIWLSEFETGYSPDLLQSQPVSTDLFYCVVCKSLPRHPVMNAQCRHLLCAYCAMQLVKTSGKPVSAKFSRRKMKCPVCRQDFNFRDFTTHIQFNYWDNALFNEIKIRCSNSCGFQAELLKMDEHECFSCPKRIISCPHKSCKEEGTAEKIEEHFPLCPNRQVFCKSCEMSVYLSEIEQHNCIKRLRIAIEGIIAFNIFI